MLDKLRQLAQRLEASGELAPPHYDWLRIAWLIDLDGEGRFLGFVRTPVEERRKARGKRFLAPHVQRASGVEANLLADRADYALGFVEPDAGERTKQRTKQAHEASLALLKECAGVTNEPTVATVARFLETLDLAALDLPQDLKAGDNVTFRVEGLLPIELPSVQSFWARVREPKGEQAQCLVCGESRPPSKRLPIKIKRIPLGQSSGMALVSANEAAFESYGLEASLISPVCDECAQRYAKALNALRDKDDSHIVVGPLVYYFWTRDQVAFSPGRLLSSPEPDEVRALVDSVRTGRARDTTADVTPFYAAGLSASGGRVVVRDWLETSVDQVKQSLVRWFRLQSIVGAWGETGAGHFPLRGYRRDQTKSWVEGLADSVVPEVRGRRDISQVNPNVPKVLLRAALHGDPLPMWLLSDAVSRCRAEREVTQPRAALIKMVLLSNQPYTEQEDNMEQLDPENRSPAYLCGRLLAVLESIQRAALPGIQATILDRFYGTASSAPASVFGTLLRGAQAHLGKLRKESEPAFHALQRRLEEVCQGLPAFPPVLSLHDQGLFALGYWHQCAAGRAAAIAHKQATTRPEVADPA
jgi:CRISPR-associated protein Csd1